MRTTTWFLLAATLLANSIGPAYADQLRPLLNDLKSADTATVLKAIEGLGESGDIRAVPPLLEALRDKRGVVRQYTVEALQHLVQALDDGYLVVKRWLQSLINRLRLDPADDVITVEQFVVEPLGKAALSVNMGSKMCV
jgi:HEAT repeat protein